MLFYYNIIGIGRQVRQPIRCKEFVAQLISQPHFLLCLREQLPLCLRDQQISIR